MPTEPTRQLHYVIEGDAGKPVLVMSNSLGTTLEMWRPQMAALTQHYRVLRYDTRGHGRSALPATSFGFDELAADVIAIPDGLGGFEHNGGLHVVDAAGRVLAVFPLERFSDAYALARSHVEGARP